MKTYKVLNNFIYHNNLINKNDKIVMAVSGGIDSLVMSQLLKYYCDRRNANIHLQAVYVHIQEVAISDDQINYLENYFTKQDIPFTVLDGKVYKNLKFNCYTCSRERRKQLCAYVIEHGLTSIAYGHILDDYLETGLMNMIAHGHLESLDPVDFMFDKQVKIIRPLLRFPKNEIYKIAHEKNLQPHKHTCGFEHHNMRDDVRQLIQQQEKIHPVYRKSLRKIINRWNNTRI